ncbi:MAG TPA: GNAT family protein [Hanamia sp.]|nr:GNAT family protein [Hanamia sp.]
MILKIDENISLELTSAKHAQGLFDAVDANRKHLSEFLPWVGNMKSVADFKDYIQDCESLYRQKKEVSFVIFSNKKTIGRIGLHHMNLDNKTAAIGYWITKDAQGKGIITQSCKKLISYGFAEIGLHRIEIKAAVQNLKSQAIPKRLNFTKEGILRQAELVNGKYLDIVLFSILENEWKEEEKDL